MTHKRILRVREAIRRELGVILDRKMSDPRVGMVTVTRVDLSDDLKYAKVLLDELDSQIRMSLLGYERKFQLPPRHVRSTPKNGP